MTEEERVLTDSAKAYAKKNKVRIAREVTDVSIYKKEDFPVSIFMAGSPGAGKTESSIRLIEELAKIDKRSVLRIDADECRKFFDAYDGSNSHLFQGAVSLLVEKVHDMALSNSQSFVFDGTLSRYEKAVENIERSLKKNRPVQILYVYQEPLLAWEFTKKREEKEGRKILKEDFIRGFFESRNTVNKLKELFGDSVVLSLIIKDIDNSEQRYEKNIQKVEDYIENKFSLQDLENLLQ